jgi:hypothetical protein
MIIAATLPDRLRRDVGASSSGVGRGDNVGFFLIGRRPALTFIPRPTVLTMILLCKDGHGMIT